MGRPRKHFPPTNPEDLMRESSMADVTDITLPEGVPRNPDGTPKVDGEIAEFTAQKIGALDIESAQRNKTVAEAMRDVKLGKSVRWNTDDAMEMFPIVRDVFRGEWSSMWLMIDRDEPRASFPPLSGKQLSDPLELYRAIEHYHGKSPAAKYIIQFRLGGAVRGKSYVWMPDNSDVQVMPYGAPPPQYYPQGQHPGQWSSPGAPQPQVVVVSQRPEAPRFQEPPPPPPSKQESPVHHHYPAPPAPAPAPSSELTQVLAQLSQQNAMMMTTMREIVEASRKPPGFIALPEGHAYPIPQGYIAVPGGMMPSPVGLGQVPQPVQAQAPAPQPSGSLAGFAAQQSAPAKAVTESDQIQAAVKSLQTILDGAKKIEDLVGSIGGGGGNEPDAPATPESPRIVQDVGGLHMIIDKATGKTNWAETVLGAMPKLADAGRSILGEFQKTMEKQALLTSRAVAERTHLAASVESAARAQTQAAQARVAAQASAPARPAQVAQPAPAPPAPAPKPPVKSGPPMPTGPLL